MALKWMRMVMWLKRPSFLRQMSMTDMVVTMQLPMLPSAALRSFLPSPQRSQVLPSQVRLNKTRGLLF